MKEAVGRVVWILKEQVACQTSEGLKQSQWLLLKPPAGATAMAELGRSTEPTGEENGRM